MFVLIGRFKSIKQLHLQPSLPDRALVNHINRNKVTGAINSDPRQNYTTLGVYACNSLGTPVLMDLKTTITSVGPHDLSCCINIQ